MAVASARHILVQTEEECLKLKDLILDEGKDFSEIARDYSKCPSKEQGGDLGQFGPGMMVKEFDEVVFNAKINSLQGPIKTQFGYHLLEVLSRS
tara:strand:+ start:126 stop:407 length:282 start_codon:yes stop_codon:yes gene_type:complete